MLIDWFTVGAQVVNFLVLVALLKRYAYKPILNAIDAREQRIVAQQTEAVAKDEAAKTLGSELQQKTAAFDAELTALRARNVAQISQDRDQQLTHSRQYGEQLRAAERADLVTERRNLGERVARAAGDAVWDSVRKTLADLGGVALDERILAVFCERLRNLDAAAKSAFTVALAKVPAATVRSSFALTAAARLGLQQTLEATFGTRVPLEFTADPSIIGGVEITAGGQKLAWNIADYLQTLGHELDTLLAPVSLPAAAPK